jgi:hypothetical protein
MSPAGKKKKAAPHSAEQPETSIKYYPDYFTENRLNPVT